MIIAVSACGVVALVAVWIFLEVFVNKGQGTTSDVDLARIEASIEKFIEKAEIVRAGGGSSLAGPSGSIVGAGQQVDTVELTSLKKELEAKKIEIETLKSKKPETKEDNTPELLAKIRDLEARLAEYEIIEDDIADLSHYKEENEKLKKQLAGLGGSAAVEANPVAATLEVSDESQPSAIVEDFSKAVDDLKSEVVTPEEPIPEMAPSVASVDEDQPAKVAATEGTSGDVFSEFEEKNGDANDPLAELGDIDTSRMLEELQGLEIDTAASADVLMETPDIDKMAEEVEEPKGKQS